MEGGFRTVIFSTLHGFLVVEGIAGATLGVPVQLGGSNSEADLAAPERRGTGMVFQNDALFPHARALDIQQPQR